MEKTKRFRYEGGILISNKGVIGVLVIAVISLVICGYLYMDNYNTKTELEEIESKNKELNTNILKLEINYNGLLDLIDTIQDALSINGDLWDTQHDTNTRFTDMWDAQLDLNDLIIDMIS